MSQNPHPHNSSTPPPSPFNTAPTSPPPSSAPVPDSDLPWYAQTWATVVGLVILAPVGVFLMWKYRTWNQKPKVVASVVSLLFFLGMLPKSTPEPAARTVSTANNSTVNDSSATGQTDNVASDSNLAPKVPESSSKPTQSTKKKAPAAKKVAPEPDASAPLSKDADAKPKEDGLPDNVEVVDIPEVGKRDAGIVDEVVYAVLSVEKSSVIGNELTEQRAAGTFFVLTVRAFNNAKKTHNVTTQIMKLLDDEGREFDPSSEGTTALMMSGDSRVQGFSAQVQPGTFKEFVLVYDAPADASGLRLKIPGGSFSFSEVILRLPK